MLTLPHPPVSLCVFLYVRLFYDVREEDSCDEETICPDHVEGKIAKTWLPNVQGIFS
jgi:hypothetical protein